MIRSALSTLLIGLLTLATNSLASNLAETTEQLLEARLFAEARNTLTGIAETDSQYAVAQRLLGNIYAAGKGVTADAILAVGYWRTAAKLGDAEAGYRMGKAYEEGVGVKPSAASAYNWYDSAASEHPLAAFRYAEIALANRSRDGFVARHDPIDRLLFAANHEVPGAQYLIAHMVLSGHTDVVTDTQALALLETASTEVAEANTALGTRAHQAGDTRKARAYFEAALEKGDSDAGAYLGHYAEHGIDQPIDRKKAWEYYERADGITWAAESLRRLQHHAESIELLGVRVYGVTRREIWSRFSDMNMPLLANDAHWDVFDASAKLGGKKGVVTVAYAPGSPEYIAEVSYQFESDDKRAARAIYKEVQESLIAKYGNSEERDRTAGFRRLFWRVGDAVVQLSHKNTDTTVHVTYQLTPYSKQLRTFLAKNNPEGDIRDAL